MSQKLSRKARNKISTPGYFIKRMKDNGFVVLRMFNAYSETDPRRWTVLVDPGGASVFITCYENKDFLNDIMFEFHDGGIRFAKNLSVKTESIEVIVDHLLEKGISNDPSNSKFCSKS